MCLPCYVHIRLITCKACIRDSRAEVALTLQTQFKMKTIFVHPLLYTSHTAKTFEGQKPDWNILCTYDFSQFTFQRWLVGKWRAWQVERFNDGSCQRFVGTLDLFVAWMYANGNGPYRPARQNGIINTWSSIMLCICMAHVWHSLTSHVNCSVLYFVF